MSSVFHSPFGDETPEINNQKHIPPINWLYFSIYLTQNVLTNSLSCVNVCLIDRIIGYASVLCSLWCPSELLQRMIKKMFMIWYTQWVNDAERKSSWCASQYDGLIGYKWSLIATGQFKISLFCFCNIVFFSSLFETDECVLNNWGVFETGKTFSSVLKLFSYLCENWTFFVFI